MATNFFKKIFHDIPRFSFTFKAVKESFTLQYDSEYVQSLSVIFAATLLVGVILLLSIIITWICQCCTRRDASVKSRRRVRQLSTLLFIISVLCFFCLGFCLFGNEHVNRGVTSSISGIDDVSRNFRLALVQSISLNETRMNATHHMESLLFEIRNEAKRTVDINKTMLDEAEDLISRLNEKLVAVGTELVQIKSVLSGVGFLEQVKLFSERIELERVCTVKFGGRTQVIRQYAMWSEVAPVAADALLE